MQEDIRWKQRFQNFSNAIEHLRFAVEEVTDPSDLEKEGTIQRFEFTHELAWKVMKDFLEDEGILGIIGSRSATREAFNKELITEGEIWMEMIASRNKSVRTYVDDILEREYATIINKYYRLLEIFHQKMNQLLWTLD